ncbi:hypothetical protein R6Q57_010710 [Mikania cordata]
MCISLAHRCTNQRASSDPRTEIKMSNNTDDDTKMSWELRGSHPHDDLNPNSYYETTWFTIQMFHGGKFVDSPSRSYVNGRNNFFGFVSVVEVSMYAIGQMVRSLGIPDEDVVFYHYKIPGMDLETGLRPILNQEDITQLCSYTEEVKIIGLYLENKGSSMTSNENGKQVTIDDSGSPCITRWAITRWCII